MKYKALLPALLTLAPAFAAARTLTPEEAAAHYAAHGQPYGYVYSDSACYGFAAPKGWIMDKKTAQQLGVGMVLLPEGTNWKNAPQAMYTRIYHGNAGQDDTARIASALEGVKKLYRDSDNIDISTEHLATLHAEHGAQGELWRLEIPFPDKPMQEYVAYFPHGDTLAVFVMQTTSAEAKESEKHLRTLAHTYHRRSTCEPCTETEHTCTRP